MESTILSIIIGAIALIIGILLGKFIFAKNTQKQIEDAEQQAQKIIADGQLQAENLKKEKLLEAKEKFVQLNRIMTAKYFSVHRRRTKLKIKSSKRSNQSIKRNKILISKSRRTNLLKKRLIVRLKW
jgi:ribonucrease Y